MTSDQILRRRVDLVRSLLPLSPAARAYRRAQGRTERVSTLHLRALQARLRRELPYLPPGIRHGTAGLLDAVDAELDRRH